MVYLHIENLNIENYLVNFDFNEKEAIGVYGRNQNLVLEFLKIISGINKSNACFYQDKNIYDNPEYFKSRIFLDYSHTYLSTLRCAQIEEALKNKYNLSFNKDKFIKIGKELDIRGETEITYQYHFSPTGNTFVNYALTAALEKPNIIIMKPLNGLSLTEDINYISSGITNTLLFNTAIIGIDKIKPFQNKLDKIIVFSDFDNIYYLDNKTKLLVVGNEIEISYPVFTTNEKTLYLLKDLKEVCKELNRKKIPYEIISIYDIEEYL